MARSETLVTSELLAKHRHYSPEYIATIQRHNARMGQPWQRRAQYSLMMYLFAPIAWLFFRAFFRIRVEGMDNVDAVKNKGIFAVRHYFEWDPIVSFIISIWTRTFERPHLLSYSLASNLWSRNVIFRAASWCLGVLSFVPHHEPKHGAVATAIKLMHRDVPTTIAIYPTGPIGRRKHYQVHRGVGVLAMQCPDAPVIPVSLIGLQEVRLMDVLLFKRPSITLKFGQAFYARHVLAVHQHLPEDARAKIICELIDAQWHRMEGRPFHREEERQAA